LAGAGEAGPLRELGADGKSALKGVGWEVPGRADVRDGEAAGAAGGQCDALQSIVVRKDALDEVGGLCRKLGCQPAKHEGVLSAISATSHLRCALDRCDHSDRITRASFLFVCACGFRAVQR
jgi:hypothetical protein